MHGRACVAASQRIFGTRNANNLCRCVSAGVSRPVSLATPRKVFEDDPNSITGTLPRTLVTDESGYPASNARHVAAAHRTANMSSSRHDLDTWQKRIPGGLQAPRDESRKSWPPQAFPSIESDTSSSDSALARSPQTPVGSACRRAAWGISPRKCPQGRDTPAGGPDAILSTARQKRRPRRRLRDRHPRPSRRASTARPRRNR